MGYQLRMSSEVRDWLAGLAGRPGCASLAGLAGRDPAAGRLVGEAPAALAAEGENLGPPLVSAVARGPELDPAGSLDRAYQERLESLTGVRRRVADAATLSTQIEREVSSLERRRPGPTARQQAALQAARPDLAAWLAGELATVDEQLSALRRLQPGGARRRADADQAVCPAALTVRHRRCCPGRGLATVSGWMPPNVS